MVDLAFPEVDSDIVDLLHDEIAELEAAKNLFVGPLRPVSAQVPVLAVFVLSTGGAPPDRTFGSRAEIRYPAVQIRVRSAKKRAGVALLWKIYSALQSSPFEIYRDVRSETSEPNWIEISEDEHYHWSWDFELFYMGFAGTKKTVVVSSYVQSIAGDLENQTD